MNKKQYYQDILDKNNCCVVFTKRNGVERTMNCTRKYEAVDKFKLTPISTASLEQPDTIRVIDTDIGEWRNIVVSTIKSFKILDGSIEKTINKDNVSKTRSSYSGVRNEYHPTARYNFYIQVLKEDTCEVTFTKKDGSVRVMHCTLNPTIIGTTSQRKKPAANNDRICVYDTDILEWRSFKPEKVISFKTHSAKITAQQKRKTKLGR